MPGGRSGGHHPITQRNNRGGRIEPVFPLITDQHGSIFSFWACRDDFSSSYYALAWGSAPRLLVG
jgi:hypothetical protein